MTFITTQSASVRSFLGTHIFRQYPIYFVRKWFEPGSNIPALKMSIWVLLATDVSTTSAEAIFSV